MGRITGSNSYGHRIRKERDDEYVISWRYDVKLKGSRLRFVRLRSRDTNRAGAARFAKKWDIEMPKETP